MPDQLLRSAYIASEGPLVLDGETLIGIIVKDTYVFSTTHTNASEVTAYEVEPVSTESRLTGSCTVILNDAETAWLPLVTGTTAVEASTATKAAPIGSSATARISAKSTHAAQPNWRGIETNTVKSTTTIASFAKFLNVKDFNTGYINYI